MVVEEHRALVREVLSRALAGEGTLEFEFTVRTVDGHLRDMLFNATPQRDAGGRVIGAYGVGQVRVGRGGGWGSQSSLSGGVVSVSIFLSLSLFSRSFSFG